MGSEENTVSLDERNRVVLAYLCLSRDRKFFKVSEAQRLKLIDSLFSFGAQVAEEVKKEFGTDDPRRIVEMMGLKVVGEDRGIRGTLLKRSEYRPARKEIAIYRDSLNQLMKEVAAEDLSDKLIKLLLSHELFHHIEHTRRLSIPKMFKMTWFKLGPLSLNVKIAATSEVAAHAFAQALLNIEHSPMVFDYLTYIFYTSRAKG